MTSDRGQHKQVLVVASNALDRRALRTILPLIDGIELIGTTASLKLARDCIEQSALDVLIIDDAATSRTFVAAIRLKLVRREIRLVVFRAAQKREKTISSLLGELGIDPRKYESEILDPPRPPPLEQPEIVAVGSSTGGPDALDDLIPSLPKWFRPPVLVAQHMPPTFIPILARRLDRHSHLEVREATDGDRLQSGTVLLAPGDFHLEVRNDEPTVRLHQGPPEHSCRPSVDVLFRSVAKAYGEHSIGVVLTGMGRDGVEGARALRATGAEVLVQDEETSVVWGMPGIIAREGMATFTGSIPAIAQRLINRARTSSVTADLISRSTGDL